MHRSRTRSSRDGSGNLFEVRSLASLAVFLTLMILNIRGLSLPAVAQVPVPELFAKEPGAPLKLWDAIDYLLRTDQAKKALPDLDKFLKSRPDEVTLISIWNRYGAGPNLRLSDNDLTRPFAIFLAEAMVASARKSQSNLIRSRGLSLV